MVDAQQRCLRSRVRADAQLTPFRRTHAPGFTLIELLATIGVISVLIAVLLPALAGAKGSAQALRCLVSLRNMGTGEAAWAADHKDIYPNIFADDPDAPVIHKGFGTWGVAFVNYSQPSIWFFPLQNYAWEGVQGFGRGYGNFEGISCPSLRRSSAFVNSGYQPSELVDNPQLDALASYRSALSMYTPADLWVGDLDTPRTVDQIEKGRALVRFFEVAFPSQKAVKIERLAYHATSRRQEAGAGTSFQLLAADGSASAVALPRLVTPLPVAFRGAVGTFNDGTDVSPRRSAIDGTPEGHRGIDFTPPAQ